MGKHFMFDLTGFALFAILSSVTPGPNNAIPAAIGATIGVRKGLPALLGIAFGFAVMVFVVFIGLGQIIIQAGPGAWLVMKVTGALILAWLAWKIATSPVEESKIVDRPLPKDNVTKFSGFIGADAFQWVNPKAWIICSSAIATYFNTAQSVLSQAVLFALVFGVSGFFWLSTMARGGNDHPPTFIWATSACV